MKKSVLIIGMGTLGQHLANKMQELGNEIMIVDKDEELIESLSGTFQDAYTGDCTNKAVLKSIGVNNFDYCFVVLDDDFYAALEITSILKELGAKFVVAKARRERQAEFLRKIGADEVFYPEKEIAEKLAVRYNATNIFDFIELTSEYSIFEIPIVADWVGSTIVQMDVRRAYNINIIAIKNDNNLYPSPLGDYVFKTGDHIVVIGKSTDVFKLSAKTQ